MARKLKLVWLRLHADRRGTTQSVEVLMMVAIAMMTCLGVTQVAGIGLGGAEDSGLFGGIGQLIDNLDLGGFLPF
jgi:hypothetical protein